MGDENLKLWNDKWNSKFSWKRKESIKMCRQIRDWFLEKYDVDVNALHQIGKKDENGHINPLHQKFFEMKVYLHDLISMYNRLWFDSGLSLGAFMESEQEQAVVQIMHRYSMHKFDPVWNWRKSQLIRKKFRSFLAATKIYDICRPVHIVLTLPRIDGCYLTENNVLKRYYGTELKQVFNLVRKTIFWKKAVYGGEYGLEVKASENVDNGLHIHIHSLAFLRKGVDLAKFRIDLKSSWHEYANFKGYEAKISETIRKDTSLSEDAKEAKIKKGVAPILWVEDLYFSKRDTSGAWLCERIETKFGYKTGDKIEVDSTSFDWGDYKLVTTDENGKRSVTPYLVRRKKFYAYQEAEKIKLDDTLTEAEKNEQCLNMYLHGSLECIKYHFKQDSFMQSNGKDYDIDLMAEILHQTKNQRMYDRFGKFNGHTKLSEADFISDLDLYRLSFASIEQDADLEDNILFKLANENLIAHLLPIVRQNVLNDRANAKEAFEQGLERPLSTKWKGLTNEEVELVKLYDLTDQQKRYYRIFMSKVVSNEEYEFPLFLKYDDLEELSELELKQIELEHDLEREDEEETDHSTSDFLAVANRDPISPFTGRPAQNFKLVFYRPEMIHYAGKNAIVPFQRLSTFEGKLAFTDLDMDAAIKQVASTPLAKFVEEFEELVLN